MADLANSVYPASSAALGGACPALSADLLRVAEDFHAYLAGLIVVNPSIGRTADTRASGLGEAHADVVLKVLKLATEAAYNAFQRKVVEWYAATPTSDCHAPAASPAHEDDDGEVS